MGRGHEVQLRVLHVLLRTRSVYMRDILFRLEVLGQQTGTLVYRIGATARSVGSAASELIDTWDMRHHGAESDAEGEPTPIRSGGRAGQSDLAQVESQSSEQDRSGEEIGGSGKLRRGSDLPATPTTLETAKAG